jgi:hypothetical protein
MLLAFALFAADARATAIEVKSELEAAREFAFFQTALDGTLARGRLGLAGAFLLASDWRRQQYGAAATVEYRGEQLTLGVEASWAPTTARRVDAPP